MGIVDIVRAIAELDEHDLNLVQTAAVSRRKALHQQQAMENQATLAPGMRVRTHGLKPKYLNGLTGEVTGGRTRRGTDIQVKIDEESAYFVSARYLTPDRTLAVPAACLERVS